MFLLGFFSCEKEVRIDIPGYEELVVVDGNIETGTAPFVLLSKTKDIYAPTDINAFLSNFISGATITVSNGEKTIELIEICSDNLPPGAELYFAEYFGVSIEEIKKYKICVYTTFDPTFVGEVGKTYSLNIQYNGQTFTSQANIPPPTPLDSVYWIDKGDVPNYGYSYARLTDPIAVGDAYKWEVKRINKNADGEDIDLSFTKTFNPVFDDKFINGISFDFWYENPMTMKDESLDQKYRGLFKLNDTVVIKFSKMDLGVYEFLEKKYVQLSSGGNPFASPANIPTNIKGGAIGLWGAYSPIYDTLICKP